VEEKIYACRAYFGSPSPDASPQSGAELHVWPTGSSATTSTGTQILIHYHRGMVTCRTRKIAGGVTLSAAQKVYITMKDPLWTVQVDADDTVTVRVYEGSLDLSFDDPATAPVTVEQGMQASVSATGKIGDPQKFEPKEQTQQEQDAVAYVRR
jgi:hypothetical protein